MRYIYKYLAYFIALLSIISVEQWLEITVSTTFLTWTYEFVLLAAFAVIGVRGYKYSDYRYPLTFVIFYGVVLISALYGIYMSEGYWDYKSLVHNFLAFSFPLSFVYFAQPLKLARSLGIWIIFAIISIWVFLPFMQSEAVGRYLVPAAFMLMFLPYNNRWTNIVLLILFFNVFIFGSLGARSNILRFIVPLLLGIALFFKDYISLSLIKTATIIAFSLPLILLPLGLSGIFNIFDSMENFSSDGIEVSNSFDTGESENLASDTRTFIYVEEILSAIKNNYVIQGHSLARGYNSDFFAMEDLEKSDRGERGACEVSILNVFNYMGIIGVIAYSMIFAGAILSVFKRSQNKIVYFVLLYVMYRWVWAWVEDLSYFDVNIMVLWMALAICYSDRFLRMNDMQFVAWVKSISIIR